MAQYDVRLQVRRDTAINWANNNPVLLVGELAIAYNTDVNGHYSGLVSIKHGIGTTWNASPELPFSSYGTAVTDALNKLDSSDSITYYYDSASNTYKFEVTPGGHTHSYSQITGSLNGSVITSGSVAKASLETSVQNKLEGGNTTIVTLTTDPDIATTSNAFLIKGMVYDVTSSLSASNGSVPSATDFTYNYRVSTSGTWTNGVNIATLKTALTNSSDATKMVWVSATNTVSAYQAAATLTIKGYA